MGKKILLADDSITIQKVIELTFSDEDFEVVTVGNGRLAIEKAQEVRPDIVLCDVIMPENNGYEVCEFIKKSPQLGQIPVLLLTGAFEPFDQERAARVGCDGFLAKPFEPETLIAKVKDLLGKAASRPAPSPRQTGPVAPVPVPAPVAPVPVAPAPFAPEPYAAPSAPPPFSAAAFAPPPPPPRVVEPEMAFIPDEPFEDLDAPAAATSPGFPSPLAPQPDVMNAAAAAEESVEDLVPITAEESEDLVAGGDDASSTVMFNAGSLPWSVAPAPPAPPAMVSAPPAVAAPVPPPEPAVEQATDMPLFEEMIEEAEVEPASVMTMGEDAFAAPAVSHAATAPSLPAPVPFTPAAFAAAPPAVAPAAPERPQPAPSLAAAAPPPPEPPSPVIERFTPPPADASSFSDVAAAVQEPEPAPARTSIAGQVDVPVDMVSQIAQRVVAQVSEKVVERIVWEVVPDLAEAMIKREIERLKAELQQLG